jgi:hypothetical protein
MDVEMVMATAWRWISSSNVMCWRLWLSPCLRLQGVDLYRGPFMEVSRVDLVEAVAPDTSGDMSAPSPYASSLSSLLLSSARPLTWEYWKLVILH